MATPTPALAAGAASGRSNFKEVTLTTPSLLAPSGTVESDEIVFCWSAVEGASTYEIRIQASDGTQIMRRDGIRATSFTVPGRDRFEEGVHSFTVRAYDHPTHRASDYAQEAFFTVGSVALPTLIFTADPMAVLFGESVTLSWASSNADAVSIDGVGLFGPSGQVEVTPGSDTTYTATAWGPGGSAQSVCGVSVNVPPVARVSVEPSIGPAPLSVYLDATASSDPDGAIVEYRWDLNADGSIESTASSLQYAFANRGVYSPVLSVVDDEGAVTTETVVIRATSPMPIALVTADPSRILAGQSTSLAWSTDNAQAVWIEPMVGPVDPSGSLNVSPAEDTTYTLHAWNESGEAVSSIAVSVNQRPTAMASLDPTSGVAPLVVHADARSSRDPDGSIATYSWDFDSDGSIDATEVAPTYTYETPGTYECTLVVVDDEGAEATTAVTVEVAHPVPTVILTASPDRVLIGSSSILSWTSQNADTVMITPGVGPVDITGQVVVSPSVTTTYTITATGPGGTATQDVCVSAVPVSSLPAGSFGTRYESLVPLDAVVNSYDPERFALVVGAAVDTQGRPVVGADVCVDGAPQYGTAQTDAAGTFYLPVDGGATERISITSAGMIDVSRQVATGWNQVSRIETVTLTPIDPAATNVEFGATSSGAVHVASPVSDERGTRTLALAVSPGTSAWRIDEAGERVYLESGQVRATEFTTPDSMPAALPAASAFTYCSELSVDGVHEVYFDKPVTVWLTDFLGTQPGSLIPAGYYDRDEGEWVPAADGLAVTLLDTNGDGTVDGVDISGDSIADDLDGDGDVSDETEGIEQMPFEAGDTVWRMTVDHFTPWDFNHMWAFPEDASWWLGGAQNPGSGCPGRKIPAGSTVTPEGGIVEEDLPVAGTGLTLHYSSARTMGHDTVVSVPLLGEEVPQDLALVEARLDIAGKSFTQRLEPTPKLSTEFVWDGTDVLGNKVAGRTEGLVTVTFHYRLYYTTRFAAMTQAPGGAFRYVPPPRPMFGVSSTAGRVNPAQVPGPTTDGAGWVVAAPATPRSELFATQVVVVSRPTDHGTIAPGWALSSHNAADSSGRTTVYKGDGTEYEVATLLQTPLSGTGVVGGLGLNPRDVAALPDGR